MQRLRSRLLVGPLLESSRRFCTSSDKLVASVLFERLRVVIPKPDPAVYTFQEFKFNWQQQFRRRYPDEFLDIAKNRAKGEYQMDYVPAPRITEADKKNDRKSLYRALDKKLYLLIFSKPFGAPSDKPVWHDHHLHVSQRLPKYRYYTSSTCSESNVRSWVYSPPGNSIISNSSDNSSRNLEPPGKGVSSWTRQPHLPPDPSAPLTPSGTAPQSHATHSLPHWFGSRQSPSIYPENHHPLQHPQVCSQ